MSRLHIGNLLPSTTSATLTAALQADGRKFARIQLVPSREMGRSRGFAFVELDPGDDVATAITALQGREIEGQQITVAEAHGPKSRFGIGSGKPTPIRPLR
ncbi:MAG: RNA-binding protein [Planctomycetes bacterium]|nr:RNA-binding protein [Planctomycetota bacterium]